MMEPVDKKRFARLSALSPMEAIQAWLDGDYGLGDWPAMVSAIRKDSRISISDTAIVDFMDEAAMKPLLASTCMKRLVAAR